MKNIFPKSRKNKNPTGNRTPDDSVDFKGITQKISNLIAQFEPDRNSDGAVNRIPKERLRFLNLIGNDILRSKRWIIAVWYPDTAWNPTELRLWQICGSENLGRALRQNAFGCRTTPSKWPFKKDIETAEEFTKFQEVNENSSVSIQKCRILRNLAEDWAGTLPEKEYIRWLVRCDPEIEEKPEGEKKTKLQTSEIIAVIHVLAWDSEVDISIGNALEVSDFLANALISRIQYDRQQRVLRAVLDFQNEVRDEKTVEGACKSAARVIRRHTSAEVCDVFLQTHPEQLGRKVRDGDGSYVDKIFSRQRENQPLLQGVFHGQFKHRYKGVVRVNDVTNGKEQLKIIEMYRGKDKPKFNLQNPTEPLAWMAAPINVSRHYPRMKARGEDQHIPIAVVRAAARPSQNFPGGVFSDTQARILRRICYYLSHVLPGLVVREEMEATSKIPEKIKNNISLVASQDNVTTNLIREIDKEYVKVAREFLPASNRVSVLRKTESNTFGDFKEELDTPEIWHNENTLAIVPSTSKRSIIVAARIQPQPGDDVRLFASFEQSRGVAEHEISILSHLAGESSLGYLGIMDQKEIMNKALHIRHGLRSAMQTVTATSIAIRDRTDIAHKYAQDGDYDRAYTEFFQHGFIRRNIGLVSDFAELALERFENLRVATRGLSRKDLQISQVDLKSMVEQELRLHRAESSRRGIDIVFVNNYGDDQSLRPAGDKIMLGIAMGNLIENAIKYSSRNRGEVRINLEIDPEKRRNWKFTITNYGPPLLGNGAKNVGGWQKMPGTQMGLNIVDSIIRAHDSAETLTIESSVISKTPEQPLEAVNVISISLPRRLS